MLANSAGGFSAALLGASGRRGTAAPPCETPTPAGTSSRKNGKKPGDGEATNSSQGMLFTRELLPAKNRLLLPRIEANTLFEA